MAMPPFFVISEATKPMRRMLMSRCSLEKPSSDERFVRTMSPSSRVTGRPPASRNLTSSTLAIVDLPAPDRPVKKTVKPWLLRAGWLRRSSRATSGKVNQSGIGRPRRSRRRRSLPEIDSVRSPSFTSSTGSYESRFST